MSTIVKAGEIVAAAGDAYGAHQGGLSSPANQAAFGAAVASAATAVASRSPLSFVKGAGIGASPAAAATQLDYGVTKKADDLVKEDV